MKFKNFYIIAAIILLSVSAVTILNFNSEFAEQQKKIGFITLGDIREPGWNESQYRGIKAACEKYGVELIVRDNVKENNGQCPAAIKELTEAGASMIFLASYTYSLEVQNLIGDYPNVAFATNSAEVHAKNMTAYFVRMYRARYLAGALAGMKTKSNIIGYVAATPNTEVNRGINAFALGVQRTNPNAKVVVMWTGAWQDEFTEAAHARRLIAEGADVLTYHQDEDTAAQVAKKFGTNYIAYNENLRGRSEYCLTSIVCSWDVYYSDIIQRYLKGKLNSVNNHWTDLEGGAVTLGEYSPKVSAEMIAQVDALKQELLNGRLIFSGKIYDNAGNVRCEDGEAISDDTLLEDVNWLVKGVEVLD